MGKRKTRSGRAEESPLVTRVPEDHLFYDIVQQAFAVFEEETVPNDDAICSCCIDSKTKAHFFDSVQRDLSDEYLDSWYFAAHDSSKMDKSLSRFLLPRALELLALGNVYQISQNERYFARFFPVGSRNWNEDEWGVLDTFRKMYLTPPFTQGLDFESRLNMFAYAGWPLDVLVSQLWSWSDEVLVESLYQNWCDDGYPGGVVSFCDTVLENFYRSDELYERITTIALADHVGEAHTSKAAAVSDCLYYTRLEKELRSFAGRHGTP